ncbi:24305_t:CDS:2, partial [Dentiscutata erythropus]
QISNRSYRKIQSEIIKILKYDPPKGLVEYLRPYKDIEFTSEGISINLIDDTPIERWKSDSVSENLLLNFTDKGEENTILFSTDLNDLPWWLDLLKKPFEHYYREFNNFSKTYLCNSIWWETTNPVKYL